jgi:hypothetical protein
MASIPGGVDGINSATTTVVTSGAAAPSAGQVLTATGPNAASWQNGGASGFVLFKYIAGYLIFNDNTTPNTILDIMPGVAADSTTSVYITNTVTFKKTTGGSWVAGSGNSGFGVGVTLMVNTWYHVYAIINNGNFDVYFDTSNSGANAPPGTTAFRYIGSIFTDGSSNIRPFTQFGQKFIWTNEILNLSGGVATTPTPVVVGTPLGFITYPILQLTFANGGVLFDNVKIFPGGNDPSTTSRFDIVIVNPTTNAFEIGGLQSATNSLSQVDYAVFLGSGSMTSITIETLGYVNINVAAVT